MCGIAGIVESHGRRADRETLADMTAALLHRGPDAQEMVVADEMGLAHARLSIIDLEGGHQPMALANGRLRVTFNGEIFNYIELREELISKGHTFTTRSDTEVILHLYQEEGEDCVHRLNGQWAFAIWDGDRHKLFVSRDRLGVRPLFYTRTANRFLFASEIKALLRCPDVSLGLDLQALEQVFTFWFVLPPRTAFRNIWQLPPGHSLTLENGDLRIWQYWDLRYAPSSDADDKEKQLADELLALLQDATRIRLRSDVPVGAYLSGGLDSTLIAALAKAVIGDNLYTYSVGFEDPEFDESIFQRDASAFLHTHHSETRCADDDIADVFPRVVWHSEQPILRTAPAPLFLLSRLVHERGFKVVLTGEGADEILGGYDIFKEAKIRRFWGRQPSSRLRPLLLKRLYPYMDTMQRQSPSYLKNFFHVSPEELASPWFSHLPRWELTRKLGCFLSHAARAEMKFADPFEEIAQQLPPAYGSWDSFNQAEYLEAKYLLPGYILSSQGDRMAMAHSVESRYPFLDHRVVDFAARLSPRLKMKVLDQKHLLKRVAHGLIPASIEKRYKQPYRAPDGVSFFSRGCNYARELLSPDSLRKHGIFDFKAVSVLAAKFASHRPTSVRDNMAVVGILSTQLLLEEFMYHQDPSEFSRTPAELHATRFDT
ncbi:MAG TPA: asparagine synthase (glutamine-hydrolyzing) [Silvibacterium sp.]|nr:asparagine synthase (glutamine-hydrolyzing) [Silvibacterium sp.]